MAKLYFYYSSMNAGKSTTLLQAAFNYEERGMRTMLWTAAIDKRDGEGTITSRIGLPRSAHKFDENVDLLAAIAAEHSASPLNCVMVDEAQFLTREHVFQLALVCDQLRIPVLCYGLRTDFQGQLFPGSAALLAIADNLREVRTICWCGSKATMVVRLGADGGVQEEGDQIAIGDDIYVSLCRKHWREAVGR